MNYSASMVGLTVGEAARGKARAARRILAAAAAAGLILSLSGSSIAVAAPPFFHMLPDGSNACRSWPAVGGTGGVGTYHARQEVNGNGAVPMYMTTVPVGCMNMPGLNYPR